MSRNGDRPTPSPPKEGDWRSEAFALEEIPDPYRTRLIQSALRELDDQDRVWLVRVEDRIRAWEVSLDRRIGEAIRQAAEEAGEEVTRRILREIGRLAARVDAVETVAHNSAERASHADAKADVAMTTGRYAAVTVVNDIPTPPAPKSTEAPELERGLRKLVGKRWAHILAILLGIVFTALNAWLASKQ